MLSDNLNFRFSNANPDNDDPLNKEIWQLQEEERNRFADETKETAGFTGRDIRKLCAEVGIDYSNYDHYMNGEDAFKCCLGFANGGKRSPNAAGQWEYEGFVSPSGQLHTQLVHLYCNPPDRTDKALCDSNGCRNRRQWPVQPPNDCTASDNKLSCLLVRGCSSLGSIADYIMMWEKMAGVVNCIVTIRAERYVPPNKNEHGVLTGTMYVVVSNRQLALRMLLSIKENGMISGHPPGGENWQRKANCEECSTSIEYKHEGEKRLRWQNFHVNLPVCDQWECSTEG